jgi:RNA polymerase sigma-70 factor (ECF subfamily)
VTSRALPEQSEGGGNTLEVRAPLTNRVPTPSSPGAVSTKTNDDACLEAYQSELDYLMRTLQRLGVATRDLEDLAHEVFLVLRSNWQEFDRKRALKPYLFGIAFRVASSHRRRHWREVSYAVVDGQDLARVPDQTLEAKQARALVLSTLQQIPLGRRAVLVMHELDEIPMREVARALGIPLFTAYSRLRKARRELEAGLRGKLTGSAAR